MTHRQSSDEDIAKLNLAIKCAHKSLEEGAFPAGAVIACGSEIIAETTATKFPQINFHPESKAIDQTIIKLNIQLSDCTLYASMEPCLMCLSRSYWSGIRRIVFAIKKQRVPHDICYESDLDHFKIAAKFNQQIELIHIKELQDKALVDVNRWLRENNTKANK